MNIREVLKPGDILNAGGTTLPTNIFKRFFRWIVTAGIHGAQKRIFGKNSDYKVHHTMIYFGEDLVFSVELPSPKYISLKDYDASLDSLEVLRLTETVLDEEDVKVMKAVADRIIDEKEEYDIGQLFDILVGTINGYPYQHNAIADAGKKNLVCSVGSVTVLNAWRHWRKFIGKPVSRLFGQLNPSAWSADFVKKFNDHGQWDIESTTPANFSNTETHFRGELRLVGKFQNGKQVEEINHGMVENICGFGFGWCCVHHNFFFYQSVYF